MTSKGYRLKMSSRILLKESLKQSCLHQVFQFMESSDFQRHGLKRSSRILLKESLKESSKENLKEIVSRGVGIGTRA